MIVLFSLKDRGSKDFFLSCLCEWYWWGLGPRFVARSSRIDERGRGEDEEHEEHDEHTQERTQKGDNSWSLRGDRKTQVNNTLNETDSITTAGPPCQQELKD